MTSAPSHKPESHKPETLTPDDVTAALALAGRAEAHDGVAPLSEEFILALRESRAPQLVHRSAPDGDVDEPGAVVGIAVRSGDAVEIAVDPPHRRRGIGRALLDAAHAADPSTRSWAHGDLPGARALAAAAGLRPVRELLKLGRALTADDAALPPDPRLLALADAPDGDAHLAAWLTLNALAFADHPEQGRWGPDDLAARTREPWFDPQLLWLLPGGAGTTDADASIWLKPEAGSGVVEIYVVAVHPDRAGRGLGGAVLRHALGEAARRGFGEIELYVDGGNTAARRLYERAGFGVRTVDVQYAT